MRLFHSILAVLVTILLFGAAMEGGLRLLGFAPPKTLNRFDAVTGWSKTPGLRVQRCSDEYTVDFAFNAQGLREDTGVTPTSKSEDELRVLCLGDSFVLGYSVQRKDLFVDLLDGRWGSQAEAINVGTEGWSTDQAVAWLEDHGQQWQADVVLLMPYENDLFWNTQQNYTRYPKPRYGENGQREKVTLLDPGSAPLRDRSALARLFLPRGPGLPRIESQGRSLLAEHGVLLTDGGPHAQAVRSHTLGSLRALARWSKASNIRVLLCPIPSHAAIDKAYAQEIFGPQVMQGLPAGAWDANRPVELFLELARDLELPSVDARPALKASLEKGEQPYFSIDWHLNPTGNRVLAQVLHDELARLGWVSTGTEPAPPAAPQPAAPLSGPIKLYLALVLILGTLYSRQYPDTRLTGGRAIPIKRAWILRLLSMVGCILLVDGKVIPTVPALAMALLLVGSLLGLVFGLVLGSGHLLGILPPDLGRVLSTVVVLTLLAFVAWKLGDRMTIIAGLLGAFIRRGHWYLMPLLVVLLTMGSLLVVAASSPLVAPFIYTLF